MTVFHLVWRYFRARLLLNLLTSLTVAIGIALVVAASALSSATRTSVLQTAGGFQLLVTAPGSPVQAVLSTLFFLDVPIGNIPIDLYRELQQDPGVERLVPVNLGDSYRGHYIVGTTPEYFELLGETIGRPVEAAPPDRAFTRPFEVVLGATTARDTGLGPGDIFVGEHGFIDLPEELAHAHEEHPYTVVAVLAPTRTPADRAIFTSLETVWEVHHQRPPPDIAGVGLLADAAAGDHIGGAAHEERHAPDGDADPDHVHHDDRQGDHHHDHDHDEATEMTALFVKGESYVDLLRLSRSIDQSAHAQAIVPGRIITQLFEYLETGETVVLFLAWFAIAVAFVAIMISVLAATIERRREIATMRALGAGRGMIVTTLMLETASIAVLGAVVGVVIGRAAAYVVGGAIERMSGVHLQLAPIAAGDLLVVGIGLALALIAGLVPAYAAYRQDIATQISPYY
jgi:putative ABC transport system permease protein